MGFEVTMHKNTVGVIRSVFVSAGYLKILCIRIRSNRDESDQIYCQVITWNWCFSANTDRL